MANLVNAVIRQQIEEVTFGFYTDDDVRNRSVVEITSPLAYDALGTTLPRGLYDPRLGPVDRDGGSCVTCGNPYLYCPGHTGHINLCVPVYHILTFPKLLQLLRGKCLNCHAFRIPKHIVSSFCSCIRYLRLLRFQWLTKLTCWICFVLVFHYLMQLVAGHDLCC